MGKGSKTRGLLRDFTGVHKLFTLPETILVQLSILTCVLLNDLVIS